jgi:uncharacterized protein YgiM (DUF1202 family)
MSGRFHRVLSIGLGLAALLAPPTFSRAQEPVQLQPEVDNSRFQFSGVVNSPDVYVRSGPGEAYYATIKLTQGTPVTVVGIKYDWLKILPPAGSFCYVSKLFVERRGDGSVGRVNRPDINVRAGSEMSAMKTTVLSRLNVGDDVKIVGEQDEYYKISPPQGTYLYVNKQFINPVKELPVAAAPVDSGDQSQARQTDTVAEDDSTTRPSSSLVSASAIDAPAATQPSAVVQPPAGPSPAELSEQSFKTLEAEFTAASAKPLEQQPIADLSKRYEALSNDANLADADRQTAGFRLAILKVRQNAQEKLADVTRMESQAAARTQSLKVEQDELQKRLDSQAVSLYAAVGTLQASSLQYGAQTLYRLTDPATNRTVVYVRGSDADALKLIGQFVGVRGQSVTDDRLNVQVIEFTAVEPVDASLVNTKVIANITPPSLLGHAIQASAGN